MKFYYNLKIRVYLKYRVFVFSSMFELENLSNQKYINLQTFRKNGEAVNTAVWFIIFNQRIYVITRELTGKVKRIKNNNVVKIAPCSLNGRLKGEWISGRANFTSEDETVKAVKLIHRKYGLWSRIVGIFSSKSGARIGISIKID